MSSWCADTAEKGLGAGRWGLGVLCIRTNVSKCDWHLVRCVCELSMLLLCERNLNAQRHYIYHSHIHLCIQLLYGI